MNALARWPQLTPETRLAIAELLGDYPTLLRSLSTAWADYLGVDADQVVTTAGCLDALRLACVALGIGPGDDVLVPAYAFQGTYFPILQAGARVRFVDIDHLSQNIDPALLVTAITPATKAIVAVHTHGHPADMVAIQRVCSAYNLFLIEDACQAHGSVDALGRKCGTIGDIGCFSLSNSKPLPSGQGGLMVVNTQVDMVVEVVRRMQSYGEQPAPSGKRPYLSRAVEHAYTISEPAAAMALALLPTLDATNERANRRANQLSEGLADMACLGLPVVGPGKSYSTWHKYRLQYESDHDPDTVVDMLRRDGVSATRWQTVPANLQPCLATHPQAQDCFPVAKRLLSHSVIIGEESYPMAVQTEESIQQAVALLRHIFLRG